jgi:hypothetical protein
MGGVGGREAREVLQRPLPGNEESVFLTSCGLPRSCYCSSILVLSLSVAVQFNTSNDAPRATRGRRLLRDALNSLGVLPQ